MVKLKHIYYCWLIWRSGLFDRGYYLRANPQVRTGMFNPLRHFVTKGWQDGHNPSPQFNTAEYLRKYYDVRREKINPLIHYIKFGKKEGRSSIPYQGNPQIQNLNASLRIKLPSHKNFHQLDLAHCKSYFQASLPQIKQSQFSPDKRVDILLPVYNGSDFLIDSISSIIAHTHIPYKLIIIDDASPDEDLKHHLINLSNNYEQVKFILNQSNIGFVRSINQAASQTKNHFVILKSNIIVPDGWLERLIAPILLDNLVASVTPFTNAGTICSFPEINVANEMFENFCVEQVDALFNQINGNHTILLPTGVAFCMAVNRHVWEEIGGFDTEKFDRGHGEENDWCFRAKSRGYIHVLTPNLFVYRQLSSSLSSPVKVELSEKNLNAMLALYPDYLQKIARFSQADPAKTIRQFALFLLMIKHCKNESVLIIDHEIGGGANQFRDQFIREKIQKHNLVLLLTFDLTHDVHKLSVFYKDYQAIFVLNDLKNCDLLKDHLQINQISINNFVSFPTPGETASYLMKLQKDHGAKLSIFIHDYYLLCSSSNLLNKQGEYCDLPPLDVCRKCLPMNPYRNEKHTQNILDWRENFSDIILNSDEIIHFSEHSKFLILKIYPGLRSFVLKPNHKLEFTPTKPKIDWEKPLSIGIIGHLTYSKGREIIQDLARILNRKDHQAKIIIIGKTDRVINKPNVVVTGTYVPEELPRLIKKYHINICFFSSIIPETYSYVLSELMAMDMPICCFDIGAQAERIKGYHLGRVIDSIDPMSAYEEIRKFHAQLKTGTHEPAK